MDITKPPTIKIEDYSGDFVVVVDGAEVDRQNKQKNFKILMDDFEDMNLKPTSPGLRNEIWYKFFRR